MRSRNVRLVFGLAAALALSMVVASSALAAPEWYEKKGGTWKKVTTAVQVNFYAEAVKLIESAPSGYWGFKCLGTEPQGEGTVESGALGNITGFLSQSAGGCKGIKEGEGTKKPELCTTLGSRQTTAGPWTAPLTKEASGEIRAALSPHSGGEEPGLTFECKNGVFGTHIANCNAKTSAKITNQIPGEKFGPIFTFDSKSKKTTCNGEAETGEWSGAVYVRQTAKETEAGVEELKVE
jgi:hypothetical protein